MHRIVKAVIYSVVVLLGLIAAYLTAAVAGTLWTAPGAAVAATDRSNVVYVLSNGFHSDIALPVVNGQPPAGIPVRDADLPHGLAQAHYLIIGWGSQTAYTSLLALTDLTPGIVVRALAFDRTVVHVLPIPGAPYGDGVYRVELDDAQYERLVRFIADAFKTDPEGEAELIDGVTQGFGDVFYRANGRFSPFYGCNAWTGQALRKAGVPVGIWTPFAQSIEWNMSRLSR
ncbi:TIGR02117 family protein [Hoeflea poritis]|uniref:TIGR02117 family protein n=1 Tax=Hoeflea poritis TaxID=2993659 RepID=A0ABT4VST8_9HYPH|nr:TIGR02117 family protein [Hoeflea poritis]MDA4847754.1 TIGR02117 family protein [Hoeflea poritis]